MVLHREVLLIARFACAKRKRSESGLAAGVSPWTTKGMRIIQLGLEC